MVSSFSISWLTLRRSDRPKEPYNTGVRAEGSLLLPPSSKKHRVGLGKGQRDSAFGRRRESAKPSETSRKGQRQKEKEEVQGKRRRLTSARAGPGDAKDTWQQKKRHSFSVNVPLSIFDGIRNTIRCSQSTPFRGECSGLIGPLSAL